MIIHISGWSNLSAIVFGDCASRRVMCSGDAMNAVHAPSRSTPIAENESSGNAMRVATTTTESCFHLYYYSCYSTRQKVWINFNMGCDNMKKKRK